MKDGGFSVVWRNRHGLVRVVWRLVIFAVLLAVIGGVTLLSAAFALSLLGISDGSLTLGQGPLPIQLITYAVGILAVFLASGVAVRTLDRRSLRSLGLALHSGWRRQLAVGLVAGTLVIGGVVVTLLAAGAVRFGRSDTQADALAVSFVLTLLVCVGTAFFEELLFRGYVLQVLAEGIGDFLSKLRQKRLGSGLSRCPPEKSGMAVAAILLAAPFGLAHLNNDGATWAGAIVTGLGGILLSVAYFRTRSLWVPVGMHISWNFVLGWVFSLPVSGLPMEGVPLVPILTGAPWLSGASFGPEGSVVTILALVCTGVYFLRSRRLDATPDALSAYPSPEHRWAAGGSYSSGWAFRRQARRSSAQ